MKFEFGTTESKDKRDSKGRFAQGNKSALTQGDMRCLFPKCKRKASSRGLCNRHYAIALRCVKSKETTWKRLEREGKAMKAKLPFDLENRTLQMEWFVTKDRDYFKPEEGDVRVDDKSTSYKTFGNRLTEKETMDKIITLLVELRSLTDSFVFLDSEE